MTKPKKPAPGFDLDRAIAEWSRGLKRTGALEDGMIAELEAHVRDEVDDLVGQGMDPEATFHELTASVESADDIGREYFKMRARGFVAVPPQPPGGFSFGLLLNAVKVSLRKMRRQKWYSLISVAGLAAGMACSILILLWVRNELSYDTFHANAGNIYRIVMEDHRVDGVSFHPWLPYPLGPALKAEFPEIASVSRWAPEDMVVRYGEEAHTETRFLTVDPVFFEMFSFHFVEGTPAQALADPSSIVIRDTMVRKYFGNQDPLGKVLNLSGRAELAVSGVLHIPENSDFQFDFFFSFQSYPLFGVDLADYEADWKSFNYQFYLLLDDKNSAELLEKKISGFLKPRNPDRERILRLQPLSRIHLYNPDSTGGAIRYVHLFSLIAGLVLLIACVNFMNLATARFEARGKEVGLRKTLGGTRGQLIHQFFGESLLHSVLALGASLLLVWLALPAFGQITGRRLGFDLIDLGTVGRIIAITLLAGGISGLYPALFLSSFAPTQAIKAATHRGGRRALFRKVLVVVQFSLSTLLIIGTLVIDSQIAFIKHRDIGMAKDNLVYLQMQKKSRDSVDVVRHELLKHPGIASVSSSSQLPFDIVSWLGYLDWEGRPADRQVYFAFMAVDHDFACTCGLDFLLGRDFSRDIPGDSESFIINETAYRQMGIEDPIGRQLDFRGHKGPIIGVVKDFVSRRMTDTVAPLVLTTGTWNAARSYLLLRLKPGDPSAALSYFRQVWGKINPAFPCEYRFVDESFNSMYENEGRLSRIFFAFAILAVFISCLGLVGLSSYMAEEKTKEIGIRRVLGASARGIVTLFSKNFLKLVLIANAIAWPVGYVVMRDWLQNYAFRTSLRPETFLLAGGLGLLSALLSIGYQTFRAATADPVRSLRYE
jgi:putative ABC transport system permease protein